MHTSQTPSIQLLLKLICLLPLSLLLLRCSTTENNLPASRSKRADTLKVVEPSSVLSESFAEFIQGFPLAKLEKTYDGNWFSDFLANASIREVSPKYCERYFYGKKVYSSPNAKAMPSDIPYYYIERLSELGDYVAVICSDLSEEQPSAYLLTYKRDGSFVQGIELYKGGSSETAVQSTVKTRLLIEDGSLNLEYSSVEGISKTIIIDKKGAFAID